MLFSVAITDSENITEKNLFKSAIARIKISIFDENRRQMYLAGTLQTIAITISSIIFGTYVPTVAIAIIYYILSRILIKITDIISKKIKSQTERAHMNLKGISEFM